MFYLIPGIKMGYLNFAASPGNNLSILFDTELATVTRVGTKGLGKMVHC